MVGQQHYGETVPQWVSTPSHWPGQNGLLQWLSDMGPAAAAILVAAGIVYLVFGVKIYRYLITLNALVIGAYVGGLIGGKADAAVAGGIIGGIAGAAAAWPLMKYAVAIEGGICGAFVGACLWRMCGQEPAFAWAGALTGLVALGMFSFILFRSSIILYMSIQGAAMLVFGALGLAYKYPDVAQSLSQSMTGKPFLLPMLVFLPMLGGLIYQYNKYGAAEGAGAGGGDGGGAAGGRGGSGAPKK